MGDNFINSQNFVKDLTTIYSAFTNEIKSYRSQTTIETLAGLSSLSDDTILVNTSPATNNAQESYCSCFYRLLGLPVISPSGLYSPGYSPDTQSKDKRLRRFTIANEIIKTEKGFTPLGSLLLERERFPQTQLATFQQQNANSSALVLSGAIKLLSPFNVLSDSSGPFDPDSQHILYRVTPEIQALVPDSTIIATGNFQHILKPFFADPRADFSVRPDRFRVAVPFLTDDERKISQSVSHVRPLIEKVCRIRLVAGNKSDATDKLKAFLDSKTDAQITDEDIINISGGTGTILQSDNYIQANLINIINTVIDILVESYTTLDEVRQQINWIPMPNAQGVQEGFTTIPYPQGGELQTKLEKRINTLNTFKRISETEAGIIEQQLGDSVFSQIDAIAFGGLIKNMPTAYDTEIANATDNISGESERAQEALFNIGVITGYHIGIGLIDMLAIYTALWKIPTEYLVDMMDTDSFNRMWNIPTLRSEQVVKRNGNSGALLHDPSDIALKFETQVRELLDYADKRFHDKINNS